MYKDTYDAEGNHLHRIQYFHDTDPYKPDAWPRYQGRVSSLKDEWAYWNTIVIDSASFLEVAVRKYDQYVLNPHCKDPRKWYGASAQAQEEAIWYIPATWPINVITICHVETKLSEVQGTFVRTPLVRGTQLQGKMGAAYTEIYRAYAARNEEGKVEHRVQTKMDEQYAATSMIDADDPSVPEYSALWKGETPDSVMHVLLYGEFGSGKTSFAATFPHPCLVMSFDPPGKDRPYVKYAIERGGRVEEGGT